MQEGFHRLTENPRSIKACHNLANHIDQDRSQLHESLEKLDVAIRKLRCPPEPIQSINSLSLVYHGKVPIPELFCLALTLDFILRASLSQEPAHYRQIL